MPQKPKEVHLEPRRAYMSIFLTSVIPCIPCTLQAELREVGVSTALQRQVTSNSNFEQYFRTAIFEQPFRTKISSSTLNFKPLQDSG